MFPLTCVLSDPILEATGGVFRASITYGMGQYPSTCEHLRRCYLSVQLEILNFEISVKTPQLHKLSNSKSQTLEEENPQSTLKSGSVTAYSPIDRVVGWCMALVVCCHIYAMFLNAA